MNSVVTCVCVCVSTYFCDCACAVKRKYVFLYEALYLFFFLSVPSNLHKWERKKKSMLTCSRMGIVAPESQGSNLYNECVWVVLVLGIFFFLMCRVELKRRQQAILSGWQASVPEDLSWSPLKSYGGGRVGRGREKVPTLTSSSSSSSTHCCMLSSLGERKGWRSPEVVWGYRIGCNEEKRGKERSCSHKMSRIRFQRHCLPVQH